MLAIIAFIFKLIGIILLTVIALIALILIVPIRYQFILNKLEEKDPYVCLKVSWFFVLLAGKLEFVESKLDYSVKILWHYILGNTEEYHQQRIADERKKEAKRQKKEQKPKKDKTSSRQKKEDAAEGSSAVEEDDILLLEEKTEQTESESAKEEIPEKKKTKKKKQRNEKRQKEKSNPLDKLKEMKENLQTQAEEYHLKENIPWGKKILYRLCKHILPRKMKGFIRYGMEDPATTGYITAVAAIFYPRYAKTLQIQPDFENARFAAELAGKGKIRLGYLIYIVIIILLNKDVRKLIFH